MRKKISSLLMIIFAFVFLLEPSFALEKTTGRIAATDGLKLRKGPGTEYDRIAGVPHNKRVQIISYAETGSGCVDKWAEIIYEAETASYRGYVCSTFIEDIETVTVDDKNDETSTPTTPTTPSNPESGENSDTNTPNEGTTTPPENEENNGGNNSENTEKPNEGDSSSKEEETPDKEESGMANMTEEEFEAYLVSQGFPESYKVKLRELHKKHPNWVFIGIKTRDTWNNALINQNVSGRSLYQSLSSATQGYLSTGDGFYDWYTDTFIAKDGSTWFQAKPETIAYYMDPRNFLTDDGIFMFEDLNFFKSYQTSNSVKTILYTDFYKELIQYYMEAANSYNISPIYLAALSRQEVGLEAGYATSGTTSTYCPVDYTGYYNFYNIKATSGAKPVCNGLAYAKSVGWNSKQAAIIGGASWIVSGYINAGQNTAYFQKWNTSINASKPYYHQYMTNIRGVASSAVTTKDSYKNMGILDYPFVFQIPIYEGIPEKTELPIQGNPNNWLKSLKVNGVSVTNFDSEETSYSVVVPKDTKSVNIVATTVNSNATVTGSGTITLSDEKTSINLVVTAQNGNKRTYTLEVVKSANVTPNVPDEDNNNEENNGEVNPPKPEVKPDPKPDVPKEEEVIIYPTPVETLTKAGYKINNNTYISSVTLGSTVQGAISKLQKANQYASINITNSSNKAKTSGSLVTGDKITIVSNDVSQTYAVVIYGDVNGDGEITTLDLLVVQKHLLKKSTLTNAFLKAADVNKDNSVNTLDLLIVQKHLLKKSNISQS
ncbi:MAG: cadherin-like beta sandwich domain-containing protein [Bacilli bacterium]|nr:cadherin-like beta sandwich domain-containing protein [Bacilli bacterium]